MLLAAMLAVAGSAVRAQDAVELALPRGELWSGLQALAAASGERVIVPAGSATLAGAEHAPLSGRFTLAAALDRLLAGTGLAWRRDAQGSILIEPARRGRAQLAPLRIEADEAALRATASAPGAAARDAHEAIGPVALDGVRLAAVPPRRAADLLRRAPNVSGNGEHLSIRGVERGAGADATASVYLDGIPLGTRLLERIALPPLQRADFRRGPRAIRDGVGAMAGVIRFETTDPLPEATAQARVAYVAPRGSEASAEAGGQLGAAGPVAVLRAGLRREPGTLDNATTGDARIDAGRQAWLQGRALFEPDAVPALTMRASWLMLRARPGVREVVPPTPPGRFNPFAGRSFDPLHRAPELDADGLAFEAQWQPAAETTLLLFAQGAQTRFDSEVRQAAAASDERQQRLDHESVHEAGLRWEQDFGRGWQARLGLDTSRRRTRLAEVLRTPLQSFFPPALAVDVSPPTERRLETALDNRAAGDGAFAEVEWRGTRGGAALGLRHIGERRQAQRTVRTALSNHACRLRIGGGAAQDCSAEFPDFASSQRTPSADALLVPQLRADWQPHASHRFAGELRRGFVGGGARLDPGSGALRIYAPERSDTFDLRWSGVWHEGRWRVDAAWFTHRWRDRHVPVDLPQRDSFLIVNAGRAHAWGGELEVRWQPRASLDAWLGVGGLHTRYDEFEALLPGAALDLAGRRFPAAPRATATLGMHWRFAPRWSVGASQWYAASAFSDARNTPAGRRPPHALLDLALRHEARHGLVLELGLYNALDRDWLEDVRVAGLEPRAREFLPGRGRELVLALEQRW
jgi:iron complex outermembrane recepter protein